MFPRIVKKCLTRAKAAPKMAPGVAVTPQNGVTMNIFTRIAYRIRAVRIDLLRADIADNERLIRNLERKQRADINRRLARSGVMATRTRAPVPEFLRKVA